MADFLQSQSEFGNELLNPKPDSASWLQMFGRSTMGNFGEFFGFEKDRQVQRWEVNNPGSSFITSMLGYATPFVGYDLALAKSVKSFPKISEALGAIGNAEKAPIVTKAMQEVAKYAPLEIGRIATAATFGDRPLSETVSSAALDLGGIGIASGAFEGLKQYGEKRVKLSSLVPGADANLPAQLQMRAAEEFIKSGKADAETVSLVKNRLAEFQKAVRLEDVPHGYKYVSDLEGSSGKDINRLFYAERSASGIDKKKFIKGALGFQPEKIDGVLKSTQEVMDSVWKKTGFPSLDTTLGYMQYPRFINTTKDRSAGFVQASIRRDMQNIGETTWIAREKNDGLYVVAKKVAGTEKAAKGDQWVMFKTDSPGKFLPMQEEWAGKMAQAQAWVAGEVGMKKQTGAKLLDFANKVTSAFPLVNYMGFGGTTKVAEIAEKIAQNPEVKKFAAAGDAFGSFLNRYFVPNAFQFKNSPRANWINGMARSVYGRADELANEMMFGKGSLPKSDLFKATKEGVAYGAKDSIQAKLAALDDKDIFQVWKAWNGQWTQDTLVKEFEKGTVGEKAFDFLTTMRKVDQEMISQIQMTQAAYGQKIFTPKENHYMISRTWSGNYRVPIYNEAGDLIYMASGKNKAQAETLAKKIIGEADAGWTAKEAVLADKATESPVSLAGYFDEMVLNKPDYFAAAKIQEGLLETPTPKFMEARKDVGGFLGQNAPWTKEELTQNIFGHLKAQNRYLANLVVHERFAGDMRKLMVEDPMMFQILRDRMNDLEGKPGPLAQIQNKLVDKVLAPVLGPNSASKIVGVTNNALMHFNMGALNIAQPVLNMLTFMHTVMPEVAFALNGTPQSLAKYYSVWPRAGADGLVSGSVSVLEPLKIMKQSFIEMRKPSAELFSHFERAANAGIISPRMVEDYIGESAAKIENLKKAMSSGKDFANWTVALSEFMLSSTEKLSRANSFTVGHIVGRDFLKLQDDALYEFAKKFTQRTMFGYSTADRARIFTTPIGSSLGLFKNWMTHFMGNMLDYTGEGLMYNNWSPLLWQLAGTGAVGGVSSIGPLYFLADQFSKMANDKSLMQNLYDGMGPGSTSDALYLGLPTLFGVSLASNASAPFSNPARDATMLFSFVQLDRLKTISQAVGGALDQWDATRKNPFADGVVRGQLARAFLPKTIYRVAAAWEDKTINSLTTSTPQFKDVSLAERIMYMTGLNPTYVDKQYRVSDELWKAKEKRQEMLKTLGQAFHEAQMRRDKYVMNEIMLRSMRDGIDFSSVLRSAQARENMLEQETMERQFDPKSIWEKRNMLKR